MNAITTRIVVLAAGVMLVGAVSAGASPHRRIAVVPYPHVYGSFAYGPYWGPWHPYDYWYGYAYPSPAYRLQGSIRTEVTPKEAEVYVDGYLAGHVRDFNGVFTHLGVVSGGHAITFRLDGFQTLTEDVYVRPDSTLDMKATLEPLPAGEASAPVPLPSPKGLATS